MPSMTRYINEFQVFFTDPAMRNVLVLYILTATMRGAFYMAIAMLGNDLFMGLSPGLTGVVAVIYPISELLTVSFFGYLCDRLGRKPVQIIGLTANSLSSLAFAGLGIVSFIGIGIHTLESIAIGTMPPPPLWFLLLIPLTLITCLFGIGAGANVASALSILADTATEQNRAKIMGYYDISTLGGLAVGMLTGIAAGKLAEELGFPLFMAFFFGSIVAGLAVVGAILLLRETHRIQVSLSVSETFSRVFGDPNVRKMVFVYVPIIALYSMVMLFSEQAVHGVQIPVLLLFGFSLGIPLIIGIYIFGHLSDRLRRRKPFVILGLFNFATIVVLFTIVRALEVLSPPPVPGNYLLLMVPFLPILGFLAAAFPPAALGFLADSSTDEEARGATMGIYSVLFGTGLIVGSLVGGPVIEFFGQLGRNLLGQAGWSIGTLGGMTFFVVVLVIIACLGTLRLPELLLETDESHQS